MLLSDLKDYVRERGCVPMSDLVVRFDASADALRAMLDHLIRKGRIKAAERQSCEGCCKCTPESLEVYEWVAKHR